EAVHAEGFFHADMRHLSTWRLLVHGESPRTLASETVDYYSARVVGGVWQDGDDATIAVKRERFVSGGVHEDLIVENLTEHPQQVELVLDRDSMIMAYQLLPFQPRVVKTTLEVLAGLQATERDDFRDAERGKILHELRRGELTVLGDKPQSPYYGAHDTTPLFLVLLDEYELWTGDTELVRSLEAPARAALRWIEEEGDLDGDGLLEYLNRSPEGLDNQGWKDSGKAILFADGTQAAPPATGRLGWPRRGFRRPACTGTSRRRPRA
ncbi:MAG TPA: glycogen debranching N-terminal domain-containing protein, partial [Gaiellaceae bacterium]